MKPEPWTTLEPEFAQAVEQALALRHELLVLHRWPNAGGAKDWFLVQKAAELASCMQRGVPGSSFSAFLQPELPLRGMADSALLDQARQLLGPAGELLLIRVVAGQPLLECAIGVDELGDLLEWFTEQEGNQVAVGRYPPFWKPNGHEVMTAYVPDAQGHILHVAY